MRSITSDQGTEMARHLATTEKPGAPVYFCDSRSPWQRGSNRNTNGCCATTFQGVSLASHLPAHLLAVEQELNHRPRIVLQDRCPADLFAALLASTGPSVLRRSTRTHRVDRVSGMSSGRAVVASRSFEDSLSTRRRAHPVGIAFEGEC